ncbi:hypothetical protein A31G_02678 [Escherichia coli KTE161]|nr:hypothetical protein A31G_02678 [Escherichia coli KTE161]
MIWQPEFTDKTLSRKPGAVHNGYRDKGTQGAQLGGVGVRWNIWTGETHYDAWPHKVSLGVEYQHTFKAINQRNGERNNAFLTIGVHW